MNEKMRALGKSPSKIREIFEYSRGRKALLGEENVFDFSLGNPSIPAPESVNESIKELVCESDSVALHGYTSAQGDLSVRQSIADSITKRFGVTATADDIYMTCGAAASLTITLKAICNPGDEVIVLSPFFPEYSVFIENAGAKRVEVKALPPDFTLDFNALENAITVNTVAVLINFPNNPTGAVLNEDEAKRLSSVLEKRSQEYSKAIYLISDEPYRELSYEEEVPFMPNYYKNTIVDYSFSKSLSVPGERIGYIFVPSVVHESRDVYAAVCGAGRSMGYVCAPSLMQYAIKNCVYDTSDIEEYNQNRILFYNSLSDLGYTVTKPGGAFYLFVKSPSGDSNEFCERAKKYEILMVPSDSFGVKGYARIAYCVKRETIEKSIPAFKALIEEYKE
ncbi:MAG: pyridoxal phosphate-dependent aminotransferase [Clostridia bacterium]|nr:pyridoxal phosphate-dependent aminotransferase [Clostridia bacterium]